MNAKYFAKINNVYFASRWFNDRTGQLKEGEVTVSTAKLMARRYDCPSVIIRDAALLGIPLDKIEIERVA